MEQSIRFDTGIYASFFFAIRLSIFHQFRASDVTEERKNRVRMSFFFFFRCKRDRD